MRRAIAVAVVFLSVCGVAVCDDSLSVGEHLQNISVNVCCESGGYGRTVQGSGTIVLATLGDGTETTWILTANHVVDGLRSVRTVINDKGQEVKQVAYNDAEVVQELVRNGRVIGERRYDAKVMSVDSQRDVALLRLRVDGEFSEGAKFYLNNKIPAPGTELFHCGAPGGKEIGGTCSLTSGIVSRIGVRIPDFGGADKGVFDQVTCPAMGGSSGGLVSLHENGELVGIITLGMRNADSFHWMVPVRSLVVFAKNAGASWVLDPNTDKPMSEDDIEMKLEVNHVKSDSQNKGPCVNDMINSLFGSSNEINFDVR